MQKKLKVLIFSKYDNKGASSRLRTIQYIAGIEKSDISITLSPLFDDLYLEDLYNNKVAKRKVLIRYLKRIKMIFKISEYNLIWVEKELFPWFPVVLEKFIPLFGVDYIVDYDDAIFHNYDQHRNKFINYLLKNKIDKVMNSAKLVTVCNQYLERRAKNTGAQNIEIIPTVVDTEKYIPLYNAHNDKLVIGWIGTPKTEKYLDIVKDVLISLSKYIDFKLIIIGGKDFYIDQIEYEILPWVEEKENEYLRQIDIGIMPLYDTVWEKGKCGYKLIQYMASGKPVVASNIGVNSEIVVNGKNGFVVNNEKEWLVALQKLSDSNTRNTMGKYARRLIEREYSLKATVQKRVNYIIENAKYES